MPKAIVGRILPVLAAVAALSACGRGDSVPVSSANAVAASPGWRITATVANLSAGGLWAGGPRDAWLAGDACADQAACNDDADYSNGTVIVRHWDGTAWRPVAVPKAYVNTPLDQGVGAVAATSAGNLWVFAGRGKESVEYTDALHRAGQGWTLPVRLNAMVEAAVAPSAREVWAFGSPATPSQHGYFAHYNGTTWITGGFPIEGTAAAALTADDIWVGGQAASGALVIDHWDGHAWQATTLTAPCPTPLGMSWVTGITAIGPRRVLASVSIDSGQATVSYLEEWNGTSWARISLPFGGADIGTPVASDGHGGAWAGITIGTGASLTTWFAHHTGARWTKTAIPSPGQAPHAGPPLDPTMPGQLVWIPGTQSLWATSDVDIGSTAVLKYGT